MKLNEFNNALMFSNKNVEKIARKLINESCNAVLMEMYSNKCILADHTTSCIYEAKYDFDGKTFTFSDFNKLSFTKEDSQLKEAIGNYFDDSDISLTEAYDDYVNSSNFEMFESSLAEALASKNNEDFIDYSELKEINEETKEIKEAKETSTFKLFTERLESYPSQSIKMFDWVNPVKVALIDEDYQTVVNKSEKAKAKELRTNAQFKKDLAEAAEIALGGDVEVMESIVRDYSCITALTKPEIKEVVGFSVIGNKDLMESRNKIVEMIENVIELNEDLSEKRAILSEETDSSEDDTPEATEQDVEAIVKALEAAKEKATDEKLVKKIESLISSVESSSESGETNVSAMKEAVEILSL